MFKTINGKLLVSVIIMFAAASAFYTYYSVTFQKEMQVKTTVKDAQTTDDAMLSGINEMMLNGTIMKKQDRKKIISIFSKTRGIKKFKLIRGEPVDKEFGPGMSVENPTSGFDKEILKSHKIIAKTFTKNGKEYLKIGVPFIARKKTKRGIDCLICHTVPNGTINGGVSLVYSLKNSARYSAIFMRNMVIFSIIIIIVMILGVYYLLKFVLKKPVQKLIEKLEPIAKGDLTVDLNIGVDKKSEIGILAHHVNKLVDSFKNNIHKIIDVSIQLGSQSEELSSTSNEFEKSTGDMRKKASGITESIKQMSTGSFCPAGIGVF